MSDLNIQALVNEFITVDAGVATIAQDGIDAALEAVAVDAKEYRRMQKAASIAAAGIVDAIGEKAIDNMADNKNINLVTAAFKIGHEEYVAQVNRSSQVGIPGKAGEAAKYKTVEGYTSVRRKTKIGNNVIGQARSRIAALGKSKLGE